MDDLKSVSKKQSNINNLLKKIFNPVIKKYLDVLSFIYLTLVGLAIIGVIPEPYRIVPEPYRILVILILTPLIFLYLLYTIYNYIVYDWLNNKIKIVEVRFQNKLMEELKKQEDQLIKTISPKPKDPGIDVEENLKYDDIEFAIYSLIRKLSKLDNTRFLIHNDYRNVDFNTEENIIIGIDRGGAILGGLLGKGLRLATINMGIYWADPALVGKGAKTAINSSKCLDSIDFSRIKKVILVDDAVRTGKSMLEAIKILESKQNTHKFDIRKVCILDVYDTDRNVKANPDFFVYKAKSKNDPQKIKLPWDTMHWDSMELNTIFEDLLKNIR